MLSKLQEGDKLIGVKQSVKAIKEKKASLVFIAEDASSHVTEPVCTLCKETGTEIIAVSSMRELGEACGIRVGSAVAVLLK